MIKLPQVTFKLYQNRLTDLGVSSRENAHYVKWARYFLDFEAKYGAGEPTPKVLDAFIVKLASKGQSSGLCDQARKAVSIYLDLSQPEAPVTAPRRSLHLRSLRNLSLLPRYRRSSPSRRWLKRVEVGQT